jgi:hypothetical protein
MGDSKKNRWRTGEVGAGEIDVLEKGTLGNGPGHIGKRVAGEADLDDVLEREEIRFWEKRNRCTLGGWGDLKTDFHSIREEGRKILGYSKRYVDIYGDSG